MNLGPFEFHLTSATVMRLIPMLPDDYTFRDIKAAIATINAEDAAVRSQPERTTIYKSLQALKSSDPEGWKNIFSHMLHDYEKTHP